jgi:hypothetical protein
VTLRVTESPPGVAVTVTVSVGVDTTLSYGPLTVAGSVRLSHTSGRAPTVSDWQATVTRNLNSGPAAREQDPWLSRW